MEIVESNELKAYMWSALPGLEATDVQNWSWNPFDLEDMEDLQDACEAYETTEDDCSPSSKSMFRLLDLICSGKKFLQDAMQFRANAALVNAAN